MPAIEDITAERHRQIEVEGWTAAHDDRHDDGALAQAAASYCLLAADLPLLAEDICPHGWDKSWLKSTTARRNLVKAGALIVAEIDRLDRAALK